MPATTWEGLCMNKFRTLDDVDVKGKRVLLRVDLNVPMENGRVTDATRLERVAPTIREIAGKGGKAIAMKADVSKAADVIRAPVIQVLDLLCRRAASGVHPSRPTSVRRASVQTRCYAE